MEETIGGGPRFRLTRKEAVMLCFGTALTLGSFKPNDPWVVIPMLGLAEASFIMFCVWHNGRIWWRVVMASALLVILAFIGWRDLHFQEHVSVPPVPTSTGQPSSINQTATDSDCSNFVVGSDDQISCETERKNRAKNKTNH